MWIVTSLRRTSRASHPIAPQAPGSVSPPHQAAHNAQLGERDRKFHL
jgi:hypothetical protein